jgi:hypothetical protein
MRALRIAGLAFGLAGLAAPTLVGAQQQGTWWQLSVAPTVVLHGAGPQARPLSSSGLGDGTVDPGFGAELVVGRELGGIPLALRVGASFHDHDNTLGSGTLTGETSMLRALLQSSFALDADGRFTLDGGAGILRARSESRLPTLGATTGLVGARSRVTVTEVAPLVGAGLSWRILRGSTLSAGLRVGVDIAFTEGDPTFMLPIGVQIGR